MTTTALLHHAKIANLIRRGWRYFEIVHLLHFVYLALKTGYLALRGIADFIFHWHKYLDALVGALSLVPSANFQRRAKKYLLVCGSLAVIVLAVYFSGRTKTSVGT